MGKVGNTRCEPRSDTDRLDGQTEETIYVIQGGGRTSLNVNGKGWDTDISFTLNATDVHGIAYVYDARSYNFKADGSIGGYRLRNCRRSRESTDRHDQLGSGES